MSGRGLVAFGADLLTDLLTSSVLSRVMVDMLAPVAV